MAITTWMCWEPWLATPYKLSENGQPVLREAVRLWQEELAAEVHASLEMQPLPGAHFVVEVAFFYPEGEHYEGESFLPSILAAVEMGSGWQRGQLISFIREDHGYVALPAFYGRPGGDVPGFMITIYPAYFGGHGLTGTFELLNGRPIICLDHMVPAGWKGLKVAINVGVIRC